MEDRLTGYIMLILGIVINFFSILLLALMLSNVIKPFNAFNFTEVLTLADHAVETINPGEEVQVQGAEISPEVVNSLLNHAAYFFFIGFVMNLGGKLISSGVALIRPTTIQVHPKNIKDIVENAPSVQAMASNLEPPTPASPPKSLF